MELVIDTTEPGKIKLAVRDGRRTITKSEKHTQKISEFLVTEIEKLLKKSRLDLKQVRKILVNPGPGGFSATRTGVATVNALGYALGIPVGIWPSGRIKKVVLPKYAHGPNITRPQRFRRSEVGQAKPKKLWQ